MWTCACTAAPRTWRPPGGWTYGSRSARPCTWRSTWRGTCRSGPWISASCWLPPRACPPG
ncbi:hypothetical protein AN478_05140 [Thiohalorhabdus denitrificans]|nr:hypothetical protein AN478_05140 [Thiohalorhabdus denitrificans]